MSLDYRPPTTSPWPVNPTRRAVVKAGALGIAGGIGLESLFASSQKVALKEGRPKSVIYIFLSGGLSQLESFDLKPDAPSDIRGEFRPIPTKTPGLHVCEHLPKLAERSEKWALCRSISHASNEHSDGHLIMMTGRSQLPVGFDRNRPKESDWPSISALTGQLVPSGNPALPSSMVLPEKMVHRTGRVIPGQFGGLLGRHCDPFFLENSGFNPKSYGAYPEYLFHHADGALPGKGMNFQPLNLALPAEVDFERLQDRVQLRQFLDRQQAHLERGAQAEGVDRYREMALSVLSDEKTRAALEVESADPALRERYGENAFGWSLLLARQLVESGVRLVQVNLGNNETWDTHQAAFPNLRDFLFPPMDRGVSALLDDLEERGLLEDTLVVMASEFGRTPKISTLASATLPGRDHWGAVQSIWMAGGGVTGGGVLGATDKWGGNPTEDGRGPEDLAATIFDVLGLPADSHWQDVVGRPMPLYHGSPLKELFA